MTAEGSWWETFAPLCFQSKPTAVAWDRRVLSPWHTRYYSSQLFISCLMVLDNIHFCCCRQCASGISKRWSSLKSNSERQMMFCICFESNWKEGWNVSEPFQSLLVYFIGCSWQSLSCWVLGRRIHYWPLWCKWNPFFQFLVYNISGTPIGCLFLDIFHTRAAAFIMYWCTSD